MENPIFKNKILLNYKSKDGRNLNNFFYSSYKYAELPADFKLDKNCSINNRFKDCNEPEYERLSYCALNCRDCLKHKQGD